MTRPVKNCDRLWACLVWRRGSWAPTSLLRRARGEGWTLHPETQRQDVGIVQRCIRRGLDWTLGRISVPRGWPNTGTSFLKRWQMAQACQCWRGVCIMPLTECFNLVSPGIGYSIGPDDPCSVLFYSMLFYSYPSLQCLKTGTNPALQSLFCPSASETSAKEKWDAHLQTLLKSFEKGKTLR